MRGADEIWLPLVDEPIGGAVDRLLEEDVELAALVSSPRRLLAFKTFAYIRVGLVLGELLVERDLEGERWADELLAEPATRERILAEIRAVAEEIAADAAYAAQEPVGPDEAARERFREFARKQLESL
ncbi:MAG: hypothetical protein M3168_05210 [Actinomycetota bacterium]|nr:hypothetical protein [Actinomycetota bacterium]